MIPRLTSTTLTGSQSPLAVPQAWDSITIAGVTYGPMQLQVGGLVKIKSAARKYKIDIKDAKGSDGWTITYRGLRPKKFKIELQFWTDAQYNFLISTMLPAIFYNGTKNNVQPLAVVHPGLNAVNINSIFVEEIGAPEEIREDHLFSFSLEVAEYLQPPPQNTTTTPIGAKSTPAAPTVTPGRQPSPALVSALKANAALRQQAIDAGVPLPFP